MLEPGDIVYLKTGGEGMVVNAMTEDPHYVECVWFDDESQLHEAVLHIEALIMSEEDD